MKHSEGNKFEPNNKCKCLYLKNKNNMQRILPKQSSITNVSSPYLHITTPQLTDDNSPPLLTIIYVLLLLINLLPVIPKKLPCLLLLLHFCFLMMTLILTFPLIILLSTMYRNQLKFILLFHYLLNSMTFQ